MPLERTGVLRNCQIAARHLAVSLPHEDRAGGIAAIQGIHQVSNARGRPDVSALHFGEPKFTVLDHGHESANARIDLWHSP